MRGSGVGNEVCVAVWMIGAWVQFGGRTGLREPWVDSVCALGEF